MDTGVPEPVGAARGPAGPRERALAPDLARGFMLLLIVLSNSMFFLWAAERAPGRHHPLAENVADSVAQFLMVFILDVRVFPLFAFLFGYGMMQLFLRQTQAGASDVAAQRLLRSRSLWLMVFGFVHAALLLSTDVLFAYGILGLVLGWLFLRRADRTFIIWSTGAAAVLCALLAWGSLLTFSAATGAITESPDAGAGVELPYAAGVSNYFVAAGARLGTWLFISSLTVFGLTAPVAMLLGFWAARRRVLEEPHRHLPLLRRTAIIGIAIGGLGSLPAALAQIDVIGFEGAELTGSASLLAMQWSTGLAGGVGYVALFGLIAYRLTRQGAAGPSVLAVAAVGKRSLSCYLAHSLILAPVLSAWGFGLGAHLGTASMAFYALFAWLITVAGAYALERFDRRGPAEVLLRRLVYGRASGAPRNAPRSAS